MVKKTRRLTDRCRKTKLIPRFRKRFVVDVRFIFLYSFFFFSLFFPPIFFFFFLGVVFFVVHCNICTRSQSSFRRWTWLFRFDTVGLVKKLNVNSTTTFRDDNFSFPNYGLVYRTFVIEPWITNRAPPPRFDNTYKRVSLSSKAGYKNIIDIEGEEGNNITGTELLSIRNFINIYTVFYANLSPRGQLIFHISKPPIAIPPRLV